jgi:hypothetical protein
MFLAMNRLQVTRGREAEFESVWRDRDSHIAVEPGFVEFHLLRRPMAEDFRAARSGASGVKSNYLRHPVFEGFEMLADTRVVSKEAAI